MKLPLAVALSALVFATSCGSEAAEPAPPADPAAQLETMRVAIAELMARPEKEVDAVEVQHVLIAFLGAERATTQRLRPDAEVLAAEIYCRLVDGEDIDELMREYSDDPGAGIYIMNQARPSRGEFARSLMAPGFGNVSWRLEVGEIGVAPYDPKQSPFGWHVVKRLN